MKKLLIALAFLLLAPGAYAAPDPDHDADRGLVSATTQTSIATDDWVFFYDVSAGTGGLLAKISKANFRSTLGVPTTAETLVGDCTAGPCLDGTSDGGNYIKLWAGTGSYWTALQGGSPAANRSWRLPIAAPPAAGTTRLMNMDEYGQMGFVDPATFAAALGSDDNYVTDAEKTVIGNTSGTNTGDQTAAGSLTLTASGFDGNLATTDDTVQEVAQKLDDLVITGTDDQTAAEVPVTATGFDGNLATTDDTAQKVAQKLDDLVVSGSAEVQDETFNATNFNADTTHAVSQDDFYDKIHSFDADDDGDFTDETWFPSTSGAPTNATYLTATTETGLSAEVNLGLLTTGLMKNTVAAGVATISTASAGTDYQAPLTGGTDYLRPTTDVDDTPANGETAQPVSSNWAYDHAAAADPHSGYMLESNVGTGANNYVQLNASSQLPAVSAALLTNFPTLNQNTTGTAAGITAQYIDWNASSGGNSIANKPTITDDQTASEVPFTPNGTIAASTVQLAIQEVRDEAGSGGMVYPGAGIPNSTGSAWGTSYALDTNIITGVSASDDTLASAKAIDAALDQKANSTGISFIAGALSDMKILTTAQPVTGENLVDDTVTYGATEDQLRLWSIDKVGSQLALKAALNGATYTGTHDFSGGTLRVASSTTPPNCAVGDLYWDTDADTDGSFYVCRATNTWKEVDDDGGAGGMATTDIDTSAKIRGIVTDESGTGALIFAGGDVAAATATTPTAGDNDTSVATTAYVQTEISDTASDTETLTNKTLDTAGTGNSITVPYYLPATLISPADTDDPLIDKAKVTLTLTGVDCVALGGGTISVDIQECDANGANCATTGATVASCGATNTNDASLTDTSIAAGNYMKMVVGAPSGTVNQVAIKLYGTQVW